MPGADSRPPTSGPGELARWWREHSDLDQLVSELVEATETRRLAAASAALEELASALEGHFTVEEEVYFPLVPDLRPEFAASLERARLAHSELSSRFEVMRGLLSDGDRLRAKDVLSGALDLFRIHEEMEGALIADLSAAASP